MSRTLLALFLLVGLVVGGTAAAKSKAKSKERYALRLFDIDRQNASAEVEAAIRDEFEKQFESRKELIAKLEGAPDDKTDPDGFRKWAEKKKLRAFDVRVKISKYERVLAPIAGSSDQTLTLKVELELLATTLPVSTMGFTGRGSGRVDAQVGKNVPANVDKEIRSTAIGGAVNQALDEIIHPLRHPPPPPPKTPKKK
jgi:hypothetical protein